jgi:tetratricopeptide (TPR) repeat protein
MVGERQLAWFERLTREHQDLRGALRWAVECDVEAGMRLATGLVSYWDWRGHCVEGDEWMERLLAAGMPIADDLLAEALRTSGVMRLRLGRYAAAMERFRPARDLFERSGDRRGLAMVLNGMGNAERLQGRDESGIGMLEEALCHFRALDDPVGTAGVLGNLGVAAKYQGDTKRAMALHREALEIRHAIDDRFGICLTLSNLAGAACEEGSYELAAGWLAECVPLARQLGDRSALITALGQLGDVASAQGAHAEAAARYRESLQLIVEIGEPMNLISNFAGLVVAAARQGSDRRAARLAGATVSLHEANGREHPSVPRPEWDQVLAEVEGRIGAAAYRASYAAGGTLSLAEAVAEASEL